MRHPMHIDQTTHERGSDAKIYTYEADYVVAQDRISWKADVRLADEPKLQLSGAIPVTSPAIAAIAEQAVRDAVITKIDALKQQA